jgi:hypothetical protein
MVSLRKENPILFYGGYEFILPDHPQVYAYTCTLGGDKMLVRLNSSAKEAPIPCLIM